MNKMKETDGMNQEKITELEQTICRDCGNIAGSQMLIYWQGAAQTRKMKFLKHNISICLRPTAARTLSMHLGGLL